MMTLVLTSGACPEQYDAMLDGKKVGYLRLRHGTFRVDVPDCGGKTIYEASPNGDGCFTDEERDRFLSLAVTHIEIELGREPTGAYTFANGDPGDDHAELQLKYHRIQSAALNEIKEMINTRDLDWPGARDRLISDIEDVAAFASTVDLTNPNYNGYQMVRDLKFDPKTDILTQAKCKQ